MLKQISKNWWMIEYDGCEGRFVWFGYTEGEVKGKFESWFRRMHLRPILREQTMNYARSY